MARKFKSFIDGFMEYTEGKGSPRLYRLWSAIFLVGAACERKVWTRTVKGKLYPNQYILLVGPPGLGKSLCTDLCYEFLSDLRSPETPFFLAPSSVTKASLIDNLDAASRRIIRPMESPAVVSFNSLSVVSNEFGVFLPSWEGDFMAVLTDIWDCKQYSETRRTAKININIPHTQLNIFSATSPAYLNKLLPEGAWEEGFMSRMLICYSGELIHVDLFAELSLEEKTREKLLQDLRAIYSMYGEITISDEVKIAINEWSKAGGPPIPDHPKLAHYRTRRAAHLLKLCLVASVAAGDAYTVSLDHFAEALDWLVHLEKFMPDVFKSMKAGGDARVIEECWHFAYEVFMKDKKPVPEHRIYSFLQERTPVHNIERLLDVMVRAQLLDKKYRDDGKLGYEPMGRRAA